MSKAFASAMAGGKPFDEIANLKFYASEERELEAARDVLPAIGQALAALSYQVRVQSAQALG